MLNGELVFARARACVSLSRCSGVGAGGGGGGLSRGPKRGQLARMTHCCNFKIKKN